MELLSETEPEGDQEFTKLVGPLMAAVLLGFFSIGIALPALPAQVSGPLGFGPFVVGLVTGSQFAASLLSRFYAGGFADAHGGRRAMLVGLSLAALGGSFYALSYFLVGAPQLSILVLLAGRAVIGGAESFVITGGMTLGLAVAGTKHTGRVIAWVGTAMFAALALGAPVGSLLFDRLGFFSIAIATIVISLASMLAVKTLPVSTGRPPVYGSVVDALKIVWLPGLCAAFNGVGFAALVAFAVLVFAQNDWPFSWLPVTAFALALMAARLLFSQMVDRKGGLLVGSIFTPVVALGQILIWLSYSPWLATIGAALTGAGWAMVYPAFGAEAVRRMGDRNKGLAMAAYSAFPDLSIGVAGPALGALAAAHDVQAAYIWSGAAVLIALPTAVLLRWKPNGQR